MENDTMIQLIKNNIKVCNLIFYYYLLYYLFIINK